MGQINANQIQNATVSSGITDAQIKPGAGISQSKIANLESDLVIITNSVTAEVAARQVAIAENMIPCQPDPPANPHVNELWVDSDEP